MQNEYECEDKGFHTRADLMDLLLSDDAPFDSIQLGLDYLRVDHPNSFDRVFEPSEDTWQHLQKPSPQPKFDEEEEELLVPNTTVMQNQVEAPTVKPSKKQGKRDDNTIDRVVLTALRDPIIEECGRLKLWETKRVVQSLPRTLVGIEQLFSLLQISPSSSKMLGDLLTNKEKLRQKGLMYERDQERQKCFYEHFDCAIQALEQGANYKERMNLLWNGRRHQKQLATVQEFRERHRATFNKQ